MEIKKLDLNNLVGIKNLLNYKNLKNANKNNKINSNIFKKNKSLKPLNIKKENEKNKNEEPQSILNKSFNNHMVTRKKTKEVSFKLNNLIDEIKKDDNDNDNENQNEVKQLIRDFSSISKQSTMYKTKKKFFSSTQLKNNYNKSFEEKNNNSKNKKSNKSAIEKKFVRSFSANNLMNNNKSNIFGDMQFITALNPLLNKRHSARKISDNKSFFFNKIKEEKKFLTYFDIQKIYFLDKKVYKPNKEFERKISKLKKNNSNHFIMNFNLDSYKMTILNLFQKHVSHKNFDNMKKNFDLISRAWKWKDNLKFYVRKRRAVPASQTEREILYNHNKIDRENRIKRRNPNYKDNKEDNNPVNLLDFMK